MQNLTKEQFENKYGKATAAKLGNLTDVNPNSQTMPSVNRKPLANRFTDAVGLGAATDVFGKLLARQGVGPQTKEAGQEFIEAPTGKQVAGAVAQTATIPAGFALTGGTSLAGQMAAGAALGYAYDVGSDLAAGEESAKAFMPGIETAVGAAVPPVLRGAGAALRGAGSAISDAATAGRGMVESGLDSVSTSGIGQRASEFASRFPRAVRRAGEFIDEGAEIAKRKRTGTPAVVSALDEGIDLQTIDFVQQFDTPTRNAASDMLDLAEAGRGADLPQSIPGKLAGNQLEIVEQQRKNIGQQIGEFSDSLSTQKVSVEPTLNNLNGVLSQNGIIARNGELVFDNVSLTPKQQGLVQEMYNLATRNAELSPRQIHQMDQLFSKLQREARFEGIDDVFVNVPTTEGTTQTNIYKVFRDTFGQKLDEIAEQAGRSDIRDLNREYRTLRNLQDNVESTIVRQSRLEGINVDPSESASIALRRLFSNATSRGEYQEVYNQLDAVSRSLGYDGARADTLMDFYLTDVKPLYPETVPKTSFEGGIRGAVSGIVDRIADLGSPNVKDQQKALRELLKATEEVSQEQI